MLYDGQRMAQIKGVIGRLMQRNCPLNSFFSCLQSAQNYQPYDKSYEINDSIRSLCGWMRSMSIECFVAFADFYYMIIEYLLGFPDSHRRGYHDISEKFELSDGAIDVLIRCKERSCNEDTSQIYSRISYHYP